MRNPFSRAARTRDGFPVLPGEFPLLGHIPVAYRGLAEALREGQSLGPCFWVTLGLGQWVLFCTSVQSLEIFKSKAFTSTHLQEIAPLVAGESLLASDGDAHRRMRSAMNGPFTPRGLSAASVGRTAAELIEALVRGWAERRQAKVLPEIQRAALDVIFRILGIRVPDLEPWRRQYRELLLANLSIRLRFPGSPMVRSEKAQAWINAQLADIVAAARRSGEADTLLGALVAARDDEGGALSDKALLDNVRLLILGGHETISSTMAWITLELASHPEIWDELVEEANKGAHVPRTPEEARAYPMAEALFREVVRMHPPFSVITRKAVAPFELHGRTIPEGAQVGVSLWSIAHDREVFPEPHELRLGRWLDRKAGPTAVELSQFGAGPHFCLGYHLAWLEGVQFAVALAREASARHLRPVLRDEDAMRPIYLPTEHPSPKAVVDFR
jgi:cytochrome P450